MRNILFLVVLSVILVACNGAQKAYQKGKYDEAIIKSIKKLQKKPNDPETLQILEQSFSKAVEQDKRKIEFLKQEGKPNNWDEINSIYVHLSQRQEGILKLSYVPNNIEIENYDADIIGSKEKAAEYYYVHGEQLLSIGKREDARKAYYEFQRVKEYYSNFRDVDELLDKSREAGTSNVLFGMVNNSNAVLPKGFEKELKQITISELNKDWLRYFNQEQEGLYFDFNIIVNIQVIDVSPETEKQIHYEEKKKVRDGWEYKLDDNGNVKKDSLGNDIKIPKYKEISCHVIEKQQSKRAVVSGVIEYYNNRTQELMKTDPVTAESVWQHRTGIANGDINALKPATKQIIGIPPAPFPLDLDMIADAGETLKRMVKDIIYQNKNVLE